MNSIWVLVILITAPQSPEAGKSHLILAFDNEKSCQATARSLTPSESLEGKLIFFCRRAQ